MNSSRLVASVGSYFLSRSDNAIAFHLYGGISATIPLAGGQVRVREVSAYPWSGDIRIEVNPEAAFAFDLKLRIPGWCRNATASVNGAPVAVEQATRDGYLTISRKWQAGDVVTLELPMPAQRVYAHPAVRMDVGRVALKRGPLVYCVEEIDNGGPVQRLKLPRQATVKPERRPDLFGGIVTLTADATRLQENGWQNTLYRSDPPAEITTTLTALPYYLWANRGAGSMLVWVPES